MPGRRKPPPLTRTFTLDELLAMLEALRNHADDFDADEQPALWNMESLIALEVSRHHWTKKETRELRHWTAVESINRKGWTKGLEDAAEKLKGHPAGAGAERIKQSYQEQERRLPPEQRRRPR